MPSHDDDKTPSILARYTTASIFAGILSAWAYHAYPSRGETPGLTAPMHGPSVPACLTAAYLVSLPLLRVVSERCLAPRYDMKLLLTESMILYNVAQVGLNGWMVYAMVDAVANRGHPFIGSRGLSGIAVNSGASYAVWVHYCDKYLEFLDTYFMILRGKMDQVSFLHIYHHTTIAWAWWIALRYSPGGDIYFGALLNSAIHVLMYSYYAFALVKVRCPWKRYLTQAQLLQFTSVVIYTIATAYSHHRRGSPEAIAGVQPSLRTYYLCCVVQVFEMVSLFVLFSLFYKRSYSGGKNEAGGGGVGGGGGRREVPSNDDRSSSSSSSSSAKAAESSSSSEDQCYRAMGEISEAAKEVAGHAAKDAGKVVAAATKAVTRGNGKGRVGANVM